MKSLAAIVGKPNVGKSTLFNRIVNQRLAVTSPVSGVTRDRIISETEWNGKIFDIADTGGMVFQHSNDIERETLYQSKQAIEHADIIIFTVDGQEGPDYIDEKISEILRKTSKPVILAINKIDDFDKHDWSEFYKFGYKHIIPVSAEHNKNIGDLLDSVTESIADENLTPSVFSGIKVSLVGRPNVGQSSLFNKISGETRSIVSAIPGTTRDSVDTIVKHDKKQYMIVDTAGLRKKSRIDNSIEHYSILRTIKAINKSDVVILMLDAKLGIEEQDLKIADLIIQNKKGLIIAVNKWDLIEKDDKTLKKFENSIIERAQFLSFAPIIFISTLTGQRIPKLFDIIDLVYDNLVRKIPTSELNGFLLDLKSKYSMPVEKTRKVKLNFITQIEADCPSFIIHATNIKIIKQSFKNFIINQLREKFNLQGAPVYVFFKQKN